MSEEQINEVKNYLKIKDFYELLGVTKDANTEQIKKSYKKLALKFHPDKNKAEGSKEVFKKIAQAYDCLTNPEKRAVYDRYGDEEPEQHYHHYRQQFDEDISADNIFEKLFGKGNPFFQFDEASFRTSGPGGAQVFYTSFGGNGFNGQGMPTIFDIFNQMGQQTRRGGHGNHSHQQRRTRHETGEQINEQNDEQDMRQQQQQSQIQRQKSNKLISLLQLLPLFLIFFSTFFNNLASESPLYSMEYSKSYDIKRETKRLHINYYISNPFIEKMKAEPKWLKEIEWQIEREVVIKLIDECNHYEQMKRKIQIQLQAARTESDKYEQNQKLSSLRNDSCNELQKFREEYKVDVQSVFG